MLCWAGVRLIFEVNKMKSGCQFTVSSDVCCICVCIPYHHHPALPSASPEVVGRHNKYVNFVCHKLQKTSDMALGNETTNRDGEKKNKVNVYTLGTWHSHGMQHKNTLIGCVHSYTFAIWVSVWWNVRHILGNFVCTIKWYKHMNWILKICKCHRFYPIHECIFKSFDCICALDIIGISTFCSLYKFHCVYLHPRSGKTPVR